MLLRSFIYAILKLLLVVLGLKSEPDKNNLIINLLRGFPYSIILLLILRVEFKYILIYTSVSAHQSHIPWRITLWIARRLRFKFINSDNCPHLRCKLDKNAPPNTIEALRISIIAEMLKTDEIQCCCTPVTKLRTDIWFDNPFALIKFLKSSDIGGFCARSDLIFTLEMQEFIEFANYYDFILHHFYSKHH